MSKEMIGKSVMVTGANSGIGLETARGLARMGARVIMVCRDQERGEAAAESVRRTTGNELVDLLRADFSSLDSVRELAASTMAKFPRLDVLINNAGGVFGKRMLSSDGYEWTLAVNHLAPFLLTNLLLPLLRTTAPSRVITVSSRAHLGAHIDFEDLMAENRYGEFRAYGQSKLANVLFSSELSRRLHGSGIISNSLHPGVVRTRFGRSGSSALKTLIGTFGFLLMSPEKGARTSIYLASSPEVSDVTGAYFVNCRKSIPSAEARDERIAERLWEASERMTGFHA